MIALLVVPAVLGLVGPTWPAAGAGVTAAAAATALPAGVSGLAGAPGPAAGAPGWAAGARDTATVVLLHGLGRSELSMARMARSLEAEGFRVVNLGYPSRAHRVATLVDTLAAELAACCADAAPLHFVTHSLGGILVRAWVHETGPANLGRVVMLSPPNQGSEVVDRLPDRLLELVMGPAAVQLGTGPESVPLELPPVDFELGIITGDATLNPLFSWWLPGEDDGMVAVRSARVAGADDFLVVPYTHTLIMHRGRVIEQVVSFLETGRFREDG
ncbi:MAG: esterase/lipase family protein [Gemmatimonadota bacterium]